MDRRQHARHPVRMLVQHQSSSADEAFDVDYATDLSRGGLFLHTKRALPKDTTLHVHFSPTKDAQLISAFCRVARVTQDGAGMEFVALDAETRALIDRSVARA